MMKSAVVLCTALAIGSYSSGAYALALSPSEIKDPIYALKGGTMDQAVAYLGIPDSDQQLADQRVIIWNSKDTRPANARHFYCTVKAAVDSDGKISLVEIDTNSAFYCPRGKAQ